jgi:2-iminoacetate synthase ThiH
MPHLHIEEFKHITYPSEYEDVTFDFVVKNINHEDEMVYLIRDIGEIPARRNTAYETLETF